MGSSTAGQAGQAGAGAHGQASQVPEPINPPKGYGALAWEGVSQGGAVILFVLSCILAIGLSDKLTETFTARTVIIGVAGFLAICLILSLMVRGAINTAVSYYNTSRLERDRFDAEVRNRRSDREDHEKAIERERDRHEKELEKEREKYEKEYGSALVISAVKPFHPYSVAYCVFTVQWPSKAKLARGNPVTVVTDETTHDRPLGHGQVRPERHNGNSVVTLDTLYPDAEPFLQALLDPSRHDEAIKKIRIGPAYDLQNVSPAQAPPNTPVIAAQSGSVQSGSSSGGPVK